jgi:hypothetical protein
MACEANAGADGEWGALASLILVQGAGLSEIKRVEHSSLFVPAHTRVKEADEAQQNSGSTFAMPSSDQSEPAEINPGNQLGCPILSRSESVGRITSRSEVWESEISVSGHGSRTKGLQSLRHPN